MPEGDVEIKAEFEHIHTYSTDWNSDDTKHWHECTENDDAITDEAEHTFEWVVDKKATAKKDGKKHEECTVCGYQKNMDTVIPAGTQDKNTQDKNAQGKTTASRKTGDSSNILAILIILAASGATITIIMITARRKRNEQ